MQVMRLSFWTISVMLHTSVSKKIKEITRRDFITITGDAGCRKTLSAIFEKHAIDIVIHFAGFKSVSESKSEPLSITRIMLE